MGKKNKNKDLGINYKRCYESHPELKFTGKDGKEYKITGGSCITPFDGYDVYIGLDLGMSVSEIQYPWVKGVEFLYPISDHRAPKESVDFKLMITWIAGQLKAKKSIHVGCLGGHGRTGLVFAALYREMTGKTDAIQYVRKHYCDRVIESKEQVKYLMQHYGVDKAEPSKFTTYVGKSKNVYHANSYHSTDYPDHTYDYNKYFGNGATQRNRDDSKEFFKFEDYEKATVIPQKCDGLVLK